MTVHQALSTAGNGAVHPVRESAGAISFQSILFPNGDDLAVIDMLRQPDFFGDLNLDQVVESATQKRDEYNLKPLFYAPAEDIETVRYRQSVFRDLENNEVVASIRSFASDIQSIRGDLAQSGKLFYRRQRQRWFLDAVNTYCGAVTQLMQDLSRAKLHSSGLLAFRDHLAEYTASTKFRALQAEARKLLDDLDAIVYSLHIAGKRITVSRYQEQPDYGADVLRTFEKFRQATPREHRFKFRFTPDMNHVEAAILDMVAQLYPEVFSSLEEYGIRHKDFLNSAIARFDREIQFYLAWVEYLQPMIRAGLPSCLPVVSEKSKEIRGLEIYDVALAERLIRDRKSVVTNEFSITGQERILVVSGPNQGGKTTFARTFGQLHYLAALGCPVSAREANLFLFDRLFTHFEREEDVRNLSGKLEDELMRIHQIFEYTTPNSVLVMNESFLSTTLNDALFLSREIMRQVIDLDILCVSVTFLDELSTLSRTTVSMVSTVDPADLARRTFKVVRKPADGLAYALAIAEKYGLTYEAVKKHIARNARPGAL